MIKARFFWICLGTVVFFGFPILFSGDLFVNRSDVYEHVAPFRYFAQLNLERGDISLWNSYIFAGAPFLASSQTALFYPFSIIFWIFPVVKGANFFLLIHFLLNMFGMFLLLKEMGRKSSGAFLGGVVWTFSYFFLTKISLGHIIHISGYTWAPYITLFALRVFKSLPRKGTTVFFLLVLSASLQFFSGHIQVWLHTMIWLGIIGLWCWRQSFYLKLRDGILVGGWFSLCFLLITAVQFLPALRFIFHSFRFHSSSIWSKETQYVFATSYSIPWQKWAQWFWPDPGLLPFGRVDLSSFSLETNIFYIGFIPFLILLLALGRSLKGKKFFFPAVFFIFLLFSLGRHGPLYPVLWEFLSFQRVPARFYMISLLAGIFLITFFWDRSIRRSSVKCGLLVLIVFDLWVHSRPFFKTEASSFYFSRTSTMEWLQEKLSFQKDRFLPHNPYRIFSSKQVGRYNKPLFFLMSNVNGYDGVLQKSLMAYMGRTQPHVSLGTGILDFSDVDRPAFSPLGVCYAVTHKEDDINISWPKVFQSGPIHIYENPSPFPRVRALFQRVEVKSEGRLYSFLNGSSYAPRKHWVSVDSQLSINSNQDQDFRLKSYPTQKVNFMNFSQRSSDHIRMELDIEKKTPFWIYLSEAFYPGWEIWDTDMGKIQPKTADGYFQTIFYSPNKKGIKKIHWMFRPFDFHLGAGLSSLSVVFLILGFVGFYRKCGFINGK